MYVRAISTRFCRGRSTPAMRAMLLPLPLLVLLVAADDAYHALPAHHLALDADLADRRPYLHSLSRPKTLDLTTEGARFRSASARCGPVRRRRAGARPPPPHRGGCGAGWPPPRRGPRPGAGLRSRAARGRGRWAATPAPCPGPRPPRAPTPPCPRRPPA